MTKSCGRRVVADPAAVAAPNASRTSRDRTTPGRSRERVLASGLAAPATEFRIARPPDIGIAAPCPIAIEHIDHVAVAAPQHLPTLKRRVGGADRFRSRA